MRHLRIGVIIDTASIGGVQKIALEESKMLNEYGFSAELIALDCQGTQDYSTYLICIGKLIKIPKVRIYPFNFLKLCHLILHSFDAVLRMIMKYDLLIAHNIIAGYFAYHIKKKLNIPYILYVHDPGYYVVDLHIRKGKRYLSFVKSVILNIEKTITENAQKVICNSFKTAERIRKLYGINAVVLYPGAHKCEYDISEKDIDILFCTRWNRERNLSLILKIAQIYRNREIYVIGTWDDDNAYKAFMKIIKKYNIKNIKVLNKRLKEKTLLTFYKRSCLYIQTEPTAFGMGVIEALMNDSLPLTWRTSGAAEIIQRENIEYLLVNSYYDIIKKVKEILNNETVRLQLLYKISRIKDKYSWKSHIEKLITILNSSL